MERVIKEYLKDKDEALSSLFLQIFEIIKSEIDKDSHLIIQYGMPSFSVPLIMYPEGYLGDVNQPLPYVSLAVQKNYVSLYNMCFLNRSDEYEFLIKEYEQRIGKKISHGKSCVRLKAGTLIERDLIVKLINLIDVKSWIEVNRGLNRKTL